MFIVTEYAALSTDRWKSKYSCGALRDTHYCIQNIILPSLILIYNIRFEEHVFVYGLCGRGGVIFLTHQIKLYC